ncbi:GNAT family N-acetyltransferase [Nitrosomonas sp.]|uniref:GNAT family N-acetyltransferase n=1 Tax=Nitrosomonas sp. TaxID=42353 RepID=UPI002086F99F|nr:GNAT family N-acetyltransferase [Nitrosomonas sp.]GJL74058.1 MAG: hypothetical protein NMNS02_01640 [Nitrosomonas sp.]
MSDLWSSQIVSLKYMLSDLTLFVKTIQLKVKRFEVIDPGAPVSQEWLPSFGLENGEKGYLLRSLPLRERQPRLSVRDGYLYYIPAQFERYYIDLNMTFDEYINTFSSKTRSTIRRKIKKLNEFSNQGIAFKSYRSKDELQAFYLLARDLSSRTYQEKLLDAGLPETDDFRLEMEEKAQQGLVRAYLLFDNDTPVAYMYCPVYDGVVLYQYLGYDPQYQKWSVGTILHWFAFEDLFQEARFRYFDFTEGSSEHKKIYSTGSILCGNIFILKNAAGMRFWIRCHMLIEDASRNLGIFFEKLGLKAKIRKLIRFGSG